MTLFAAKLKFTILSLLCFTAMVAAFFGGLLLRDTNDPLTPVLVARNDIEGGVAVSPDSFRVELRRLSTLPKGAITGKSQLHSHTSTTQHLAL